MHSYTLEEARRIVMKCAKQYEINLLNSQFIIIYRDREDNIIKAIEIYFGNVNFCLGLKDLGNYYVPVSALLENIKALTNIQSQVMAIMIKENECGVYKKICHVANGLNLNNLKLPENISRKISLEEYIPKK